MYKLVVVSVSNPVIADIIEAKKTIEEKYKSILEVRLFFVGRKVEEKDLKEIEDTILKGDFIILDLMGSGEKVGKTCFNACKSSNGNIVVIGNLGRNNLNKISKLGSFYVDEISSKLNKSNKKMLTDEILNMAKEVELLEKNIPIEKRKDIINYVNIGRYWKNAGLEEITNLLYLILRDYGKYEMLPKPKLPTEYNPISICKPTNMKRFENINEYVASGYVDYQKPTVVIFYYGNSSPNRIQKAIGKISNRISEFANIIPIAFMSYGRRHLQEVEKILFSPTSPSVDVILNFMSFRLGSGPMGEDEHEAMELLKKINAPVLHPFFMPKRQITEWLSSERGISTAEFLTTVMLPELDGAIETYPVGAIVENKWNEEYGVELIEVDIIEDRVIKLINRIKKWIELRYKENKDKKVAIICYNYPLSEGNIFGGAFLNTFESIENILSRLKKEGYSVEALTKEELMDYFTAGKIVNSGKWGEDQLSEHMIKYDSKKYIEEMNNTLYYKETCSQWGEAPGNIMTEGDKFLIPGKVIQNAFIGLQPTRGIHENPEKAYHDKALTPHHQYQAYYKWLNEEFNADIMIHVGTHGTLEFLKGKECGMSSDCYPDMLVYDIPHAYIYNCTNPAESSIAKRRSHAVLVSYQPPQFVQGELYGDLIEIESLINEYHVSEQTDPTKCNDIFNKIKKKAEQSNIIIEDLDTLENELYRMKRSLVPYGLHTFGKGYTEEEATEYMKFILRYDRSEAKSLRRLVCEKNGLDYDEILQTNKIDILQELDDRSSKIVDNFLKGIKVENAYHDTLNYGKKHMENAKKCNEMEGLLKVLNGEYLGAKLSGDIFRNPEVLPTGYNLFQFDPYSVPTEVAYERGWRIAENTIEKFIDEKGTYPNNVAIVLWGIETSRTQGETLGQILSYLGVRILKQKGQFNFKYEIIPIDELNRPRIDVTIDMSGFFRDMFPNMVEELNNIFRDIYLLEEPEELNYFKANSKKIYEKLINQGYSKEEAEELSYARLFGPREGEYGNGVTKLIENKNWDMESQIGELFIQNTGNVYTKNYRGKKVEGLFEDILSKVDIVTQIRSYHGYEVTDLDDFYGHFGGLSKAVEVSKGEKPLIYINDTTGEKIETDNVENSIERGVRTRLLNPKWIEGMLQNKYHGAQKIEKIFKNLIGLSSTTNGVKGWIFDSLHSTYISDENMREKMKENNRWAYLDILERMLEANERGYWKSSKEQLEELRKVYFQVEGSIEEKI
ncbi:cobaltochelatase CobN subunit [Proteiniborus ethanoligenes]|uniref:Cobaltochelatase CobN subunit n=1 Tax=Proteiniborus ethanoligenes TaxID=415015 RepID=A0A1H3QM67_9FIRM|nr:magnesium chelatase subunit H [Proteiniborus ethanoligenes]SDZ13819.1 cobaltochelatase CobN subunit [Proteiniborus ethanoligenes]